MSRGPVLLALAAVLVSPAFSDELTQKMTARLAEEADAFRRLAPQVLGEETLYQRAQKPPSRFHPRLGKAATEPPPVVWQQRRIVSEYGFSALGGDGTPLHEIRQVISVDGKKVKESAEARDALVKVITMKDDAREKELLKEFEKYGLIGAATDFGQLILLFTPRDIQRYEFIARGPAQMGAVKAEVFDFTQIDGPDSFTLYDESGHRQVHHMRVHGEVWARADDFLPMRITLSAAEGDGAASIREEASVDYAASAYGALLPSVTDIRELHGGKLAVENTFTYADFRKFGASSDIHFDTTDPPK